MSNVGLLCTRSYFILTMIIFVCAGYVYRVNSKREADDPQKKNYHPLAIWLTPIWPFLVTGWMIAFVAGTLLYGLFLLLISVALIAIRKPFLIIWADKVMTYIGHRLLKINSFLIRLILLPFRPLPAT